MTLDTPALPRANTPPEPPHSLAPCGGSGGSVSRWFVAWTLPRREALALKAVRRSWFAGAILPMIRYRDQYRHTVVAPLWPGYLLVLFNADRDPWGQLLAIPEISGIISHGPGKPTPLPDNTVPELLASMCPHGYVQHASCGPSDEATGPSKPEWLPMERIDAGSRVRLLYRLFGERVARQALVDAA